MSEPFLAEIKIIGFTFAPRGYALCDGQILPINQNQSLYSLLGTTYGGDGRVTFALPDLRGRTPVHEGNTNRLGNRGGSETVILTAAQIPGHTHRAWASKSDASLEDPDGNIWAANSQGTYYRSGNTHDSMKSTALESVGGNQAHNNTGPNGESHFREGFQTG